MLRIVEDTGVRYINLQENVFIWTVTVVIEYDPQLPTLLVVVPSYYVPYEYNYYQYITNTNGNIILYRYSSIHDFWGKDDLQWIILREENEK